jgi:hypothetical protein
MSGGVGRAVSPVYNTGSLIVRVWFQVHERLGRRMPTATMLPDLAVGFAGTMANTFEAGGVEELTPEEVSAAIRTCDFLQELFGQARRSIEEGLSQGVDAKAFAAKYERAVTGLEAVLTVTERVVTKARTNPLPPPAEEFVSRYRALLDDLISLRQLLAEAVGKAKLPTRPVDRNRAQEAEAAYARGDTKPLRRPSQQQPGE